MGTENYDAPCEETGPSALYLRTSFEQATKLSDLVEQRLCFL